MSFLVDITEMFAKFNLHLQGKDQLRCSMFEQISLTKKLEIFIITIEEGINCTYLDLSKKTRRISSQL